MTKKALFIIPPDRFNEDELFQPKAALENAGVAVTIASTAVGEVTGDNNGKTNVETIFSTESPDVYDVVGVIGGSGTIDHLWGNQELLDFLKQAHTQNVLVSGICAGSVVVAKTGLLSGRKATCYPVDVMINELKANDVEYVVENVVAHKDIITSNGPDGAKDFGESLVQALR
ncbi:DJ-1/PfpI family protein [Brevibacillus humidisoli]|uniref:DJ-1/PfpI family protein n=1 Tax=Brevibacillus humidisoli TaxID=2895522 RepID=UPI001E591D0A|nr:DJ-1/PfpI family protein [Brevibacillus humidisoli]UFJ41747.1 DJ-1/PfpI family protein [Brevibacillus humidisoli]